MALLAARHAYRVVHGLVPSSRIPLMAAQRTALRHHWRLFAAPLQPTATWIVLEVSASESSISLVVWLGASMLVVPLGVASAFQLTVTTRQGWAARERVLTSRVGRYGESSR